MEEERKGCIAKERNERTPITKEKKKERRQREESNGDEKKNPTGSKSKRGIRRKKGE